MSSRQSAARTAAVLFAVFGLLGLVTAPLPQSRPVASLAVGAADLLVAVLAWMLPWDRGPRWGTLVLTVPAVGLVAVSNAAGLVPPRAYSVMFVLVFVWVGSYHERRSSLAVVAVSTPAYVVGVLANTRGVPLDPRAVVMTTAVCVLVAETVAHAQARLRRSEAELRRLAESDPLTGLANRAGFMDRLAVLLDSAQPVALAFVDLDGFKALNDAFGHLAGDDVLVEAGRRLRRLFRAEDLVARYGGDEFVVAVAGAGREESALDVAKRIEDALALPYDVGGRTVRVGASVGVSFAGPRLDARALLAAADASMYASKAQHRDRAPVEVPTQRDRRRPVDVR